MPKESRYEPAATDDPQSSPQSYKEAAARKEQRVQARDAAYAMAASAADRIPKICGCFHPALSIILLLMLILVSLGLIMALVLITQTDQHDPTVERVGGYVKTQCAFKKKQYLDYRPGVVKCRQGKYEFPCWDIKVDVKTKYEVKTSQDLMQRDKYSRCSFTPPCDPDWNVRQAAIENFIAIYGTEGSTFICYYDDDAFSIRPFVTKPPNESHKGRILQYAIPSAILVICIICIFALCWSGDGPAGLCQKCQQQREVQQEVADGLVALGGAVRRGESIVVMQNHQ